MKMLSDGFKAKDIALKLNRTVGAVRYRMHVLKYKTCAASDCNEKFEPKSYQQKYCSDQCRWKTYRKNKKKERIKDNLCPQCGGDMDNSGISYCKKCREYFNRRYKNPPTGK